MMTFRSLYRFWVAGQISRGLSKTASKEEKEEIEELWKAQQQFWATILGFRFTTTMKPAHMMNALVRYATGSSTKSNGDFIAHLIREDKDDGQHSDEILQKHKKYGEKYKSSLGSISSMSRSQLREGVDALLNKSATIYKPKDNMCSPSAPNMWLTGRATNFEATEVEKYLWGLFSEKSKSRFISLLESQKDTVSRALAPIVLQDDLQKDPQKSQEEVKLNGLERSLSEGIERLLNRNIAKTELLRKLSRVLILALVLKFFGCSYQDGRPQLLVMLDKDSKITKDSPDRSVIQHIQLSNKYIARKLAALPQLKCEETADEHAYLLYQWINTMKTSKKENEKHLEYDKDIYLPDEFVLNLAHNAGLFQRKKKNSIKEGGFYLDSDLVDSLKLMYMKEEEERIGWKQFWVRINEHLGLIVGGALQSDKKKLKDQTIDISLDMLEKSFKAGLRLAIKDGNAYALGDGDAELRLYEIIQHFRSGA